MTTIRATLFASLVIVGCSAYGDAPPLDKMDLVQRSIPDGPVALVDGSPVTRDDFMYLYTTQLSRLARRSRGDEIPDSVRVKIGLRCLGELIEREILFQEAERRGLTVTDAELEAAYDKKM